MEKKLLAVTTFFLSALFIPSTLYAGELSLSSSIGEVEVGSRVTVTVFVSSPATQINAVAGTVSIPPYFAIESVSRAGSVLNFWISEPSFSNASRTVTFEGLALSGFQSTRGKIISITLRATGEGSLPLTFQSAQVLANDGAGTDVTKEPGSVVVAAVPAKNVPVRETETPTPQPIEETVDDVVEVEEKKEPLAVPALSVGSRVGVRIIQVSTVYPTTPIVISFTHRESGGKLYLSGETDREGYFETPFPLALREGTYSVEASLMKDDVPSPLSNRIEVVVGDSSPPGGVASLVFFAVVGIGLVAIGVAAFMRTRPQTRRSSFVRMVLGEVDEADDVTHRSFNVLRSDVRAIARRTKGDTAEAVRTLEEDLKEAEGVIRKKLDDIHDTTKAP